MLEIKGGPDGLYILDDGRVREFLLVGEDSALLIDTGFPDSGVGEAVRGLTDLPVTVVLTHGDGDHTGGAGDFPLCHLHPADWPMVKGDVRLRPLKEGDVFACGDFRLEAVEIPGHTPGSVALVDRGKRLMFPGDSVQTGGPIFLFGAHRDLDRYIASQEKLCAWMDAVDAVLPSHHDCPIAPDCIRKNLLDAVRLRGGELTGQPHPAFPCSLYRGEWTEFLYDGGQK